MATRLGDKVERKERTPVYGDRKVETGTFKKNVEKARRLVKSIAKKVEK